MEIQALLLQQLLKKPHEVGILQQGLGRCTAHRKKCWAIWKVKKTGETTELMVSIWFLYGFYAVSAHDYSIFNIFYKILQDIPSIW